MGFLAFPTYNDLLKADGFRMFEPKHLEPLKLAGQEPRTGRERSYPDDKHQRAFDDDPAGAMFEEDQLHSLVAVRPEFCIIRGLYGISERAYVYECV